MQTFFCVDVFFVCWRICITRCEPLNKNRYRISENKRVTRAFKSVPLKSVPLKKHAVIKKEKCAVRIRYRMTTNERRHCPRHFYVTLKGGPIRRHVVWNLHSQRLILTLLIWNIRNHTLLTTCKKLRTDIVLSVSSLMKWECKINLKHYFFFEVKKKEKKRKQQNGRETKISNLVLICKLHYTA